jgi:hypothetical protein
MALSSTCHIFRSHRRNTRDAHTDLEVFIYTYAAEAKLRAMDEAGIAVHRRDRKRRCLITSFIQTESGLPLPNLSKRTLER